MSTISGSVPSWHTLSEYLPVLQLKSPMIRIDPSEENLSISFSSSSNRSVRK